MRHRIIFSHLASVEMRLLFKGGGGRGGGVYLLFCKFDEASNWAGTIQENTVIGRISLILLDTL